MTTSTAFIITRARSSRSRATRLSLPPVTLTQKPMRMEKTMSGSMLLLDRRPLKSETVTALTMASARLTVSSSTPAGMSRTTPSAGGNIFSVSSTSTAAMVPVVRKTANI